ncbi:tRNA (N(6)-L-threonylcarbamoyladenosine(37)-C(2))-methylthiotransferase MtaB [bacterium]|nr:tRNA (N(6)-L-threonylcarbamoyladenosine(37)-C(2))-methylthiotransferase MtaB [candidate division CSSED10-310 bacterium]
MNQHIRVAIKTLGCKLNQYESMGMQESLEHAGCIIVSADDDADIYIVNSCTVTGKTDRRSRHATLQLHRLHPDARIIVTGCGAQRDSHEFSGLPGVHAVLGNREKNRIIDFVHRILIEDDPITFVSPLEHAPFEKLSISRFRNYTRAFIKIQEGCNRSCSYCIIPTVRGPSRSQPPDNILEEVHRLVYGGFKEIVLTGIDLGTYGLDLQPALRLSDLLGMLEQVPGLIRIRLSSIEPMEFTPELIEAITTSSRICRHFHIPLQGGDNATLQRMNRTYTREEFASIIHAIRDRSPDACIGTDVITAFPGETEQAFQNTYSFIDALPVDYLHVFTFSVRKTTAAAAFPNRVDPRIARDRCHALRSLSSQKAASFRARMTGRDLPVIVLGAQDTETGLPRALSDNYIQILIEGSDPQKGQCLTARLLRCCGLRCFGIII